MIREFLAPRLQDYGEDLWFQQDGAPAHLARETLAMLRQYFPGRLISKFGDLNWPPRSPDLTAPDFFLWGYLKERVYLNDPKTLEDLKANIIREVDLITAEMLQSVMQSALERARVCESNAGNHLTNVIFHT